MSVHGAPATYSTGDPSHSVNYGSSPGAAQEKPTGLNAAYLISIHGILKLICLVRKSILKSKSNRTNFFFQRSVVVFHLFVSLQLGDATVFMHS